VQIDCEGASRGGAGVVFVCGCSAGLSSVSWRR